MTADGQAAAVGVGTVRERDWYHGIENPDGTIDGSRPALAASSSTT